MEKRTKESKRRLHSLILLTAFTAVLLIVTTNAWFTTQIDVNISNIRGKVEVAEGLEISLDAKTWVKELDLGSSDTSLTSVPSATIKYGPYTGHYNHVPSEFLPASTSGESYSNNGRKELSMLIGDYNGSALATISQSDESETDVTAADYAGYYAFDLFVKNSSKSNITKDVLQLNSDSSAWVLPADEPITDSGTEYKGDSDSGLQNTIRVAFARYGVGDQTTGYIKGTTGYEEILNTTKTQDISAVSIWEPNSDTHVQYILDNVKPFFDTAISGEHTYLKATTGNKFLTKTLKSSMTSSTNVNAYDWDSEIFGEPKTLQTTSNATYAPYTVEGVQNLIDISGSNLTIPANSVTKFRIYVWIEGQDPDCDNFASYGGGIEVNIGLTKSETVGNHDKYNEVK